MKNQVYVSAVFFFCMLMIGWVLCAGANAGGSGVYPVHVQNPDGLNLFFVKSALRDGDLVVSGKVRRSGLPGRAASKIAISITGLDGQILETRSISYTPRALSRRNRHDEACFTTRFSGDPGPGTVIWVGKRAAQRP